MELILDTEERELLLEILDRDLYTERKESLLREEKELQEKIANLEHADTHGIARVQEFLELLGSAKNNYELANPDQKRRLVKKLTSNLNAVAKNIDVTLKPEVELLVNRSRDDDCRAYRGTWSNLERNYTKTVIILRHEHAPGVLTTSSRNTDVKTPARNGWCFGSGTVQSE